MKKKWKFLNFFDIFFWQKSLSRDFCCCSCPGTKGQQDKDFLCPGIKERRDQIKGQRDVSLWKPYCTSIFYLSISLLLHIFTLPIKTNFCRWWPICTLLDLVQKTYKLFFAKKVSSWKWVFVLGCTKYAFYLGSGNIFEKSWRFYNHQNIKKKVLESYNSKYLCRLKIQFVEVDFSRLIFQKSSTDGLVWPKAF